MDNEPTNNSTASVGLSTEAPAFAPPMAGSRWFTMAEAQFMLRRVTSGVDRYCHVLTTLPCSSYRLISHLVEDIPSEESYTVLKEALMQAHQLSDYQRVELLSKVEPLGSRKPSDLLAAMIELCPRQHLDSPFFLYFFLQRLPREIRVLLAEEDPKDVRRIAEKADRLVALHVPQHHDAVAAVPLSSDDADVAAVKPRRKQKGGKKRGKGGKGGKSAHEEARSTLCWYHATFGEKANSCTAPCSWAEN
jgi:hypothetical protein